MKQADEITRLRAENSDRFDQLIQAGGQIAILEVELAEAREQVAGAYLAAGDAAFNSIHDAIDRQVADGIISEKFINGMRLAALTVKNAIRDLTPSDATAALEARDERVRAEERAKVIKEVAEMYVLARRSYWGVSLAQWEDRFMKNLDALHTEASREVK